MDTFRRVTIENRAEMQSLLYAAPDRGCEYVFGNIFIWRDVYCTDIRFTEDSMCLVRFSCEVDAYLFPIGDGDLAAAVREILADNEARGKKFRIIAARKEDIDRLEELFPGRFTCHLNRDYAEYVYNSSDLTALAGKKYHGKRNHIAQFEAEHPDYRFVEISKQNIERVRDFNDRWYKATLEPGDESLLDEQIAVREALDHFFELDLKGGFIESDGDVVAFSIGEAINRETFCVHIEKGNYDVPGSYAIINREFARHFCSDYSYINREDDLGIEGLRRAKLSYHPEQITEKYVVNTL